jgi:hypothetical protein
MASSFCLAWNQFESGARLMAVAPQDIRGLA